MLRAIEYARQREFLIGPGCGAAPASLVYWALGISAIDPISSDLLFDRFVSRSPTSPTFILEVDPKFSGATGEYLNAESGTGSWPLPRDEKHRYRHPGLMLKPQHLLANIDESVRLVTGNNDSHGLPVRVIDRRSENPYGAQRKLSR